MDDAANNSVVFDPFQTNTYSTNVPSGFLFTDGLHDQDTLFEALD